jgi:hypothetical protein
MISHKAATSGDSKVKSVVESEYPDSLVEYIGHHQQFVIPDRIFFVIIYLPTVSALKTVTKIHIVECMID